MDTRVKRIVSIEQKKDTVVVTYDVPFISSSEKEAWRKQPILGDCLSTQLEGLILQFCRLFSERAEVEWDAVGGEFKKLTWSYPKGNPEISLDYFKTYRRCPQPVPGSIAKVGLALSESGVHFTTSEEARLLSEIANLALRESDAFYKHQHQQLSLLDSIADIEEEKMLGAA